MWFRRITQMFLYWRCSSKDNLKLTWLLSTTPVLFFNQGGRHLWEGLFKTCVCVCVCVCVRACVCVSVRPSRRASMWTCATRTTRQLWTSSTSSPLLQPAEKSNSCWEVGTSYIFSLMVLWSLDFWLRQRHGKQWRSPNGKEWDQNRIHINICACWWCVCVFVCLCRGIKLSSGQSSEGLLEPPRPNRS